MKPLTSPQSRIADYIRLRTCWQIEKVSASLPEHCTPKGTRSNSLWGN